MVEGEPTAEQKNRLYEMLHLQVDVSLDGEVAVSGWFKSDGLLSQTSYCSGQKAVRFSLGASFEAVSHAGDFIAEVVSC